MRALFFAATAIGMALFTALCHAADGTHAASLLKDIEQYFGAERGGYVHPQWLVSKQVYQSLQHPAPRNEPAVPQVRNADTLQIVQGCRPKSCTEKAAVVYDGSKLVGAAIISSKCHEPDGRSSPCDDFATLTIFEKNGVSNTGAASELLQAWGRSKQKDIKVETRILGKDDGHR
jgi:hypothetical protein